MASSVKGFPKLSQLNEPRPSVPPTVRPIYAESPTQTTAALVSKLDLRFDVQISLCLTITIFLVAKLSSQPDIPVTSILLLPLSREVE